MHLIAFGLVRSATDDEWHPVCADQCFCNRSVSVVAEKRKRVVLGFDGKLGIINEEIHRFEETATGVARTRGVGRNDDIERVAESNACPQMQTVRDRQNIEHFRLPTVMFCTTSDATNGRVRRTRLVGIDERPCEFAFGIAWKPWPPSARNMVLRGTR